MPRLRNLADQTIVITGASSGIGFATARLAAGHGARSAYTWAALNPVAAVALAALAGATFALAGRRRRS
jgi:NAD(P)-dependent dehydrogenase (short-subunit alcohol dehydrogenase family)